MTISVVVADDHPIVRRGIRGLLEGDANVEVVGEAVDGQEAVSIVKRLTPDVLLLDWTMPVMNGFEAACQIAASGLKTRIVFLSMNAELANVIRALQVGACGYILKTAPVDHVIEAIRAAYNGEHYLSPEIRGDSVETALKANNAVVDSYDMLSTREREVFQLVVEGHTSQSIANHFQISPRTAEVHRANLMRKLGLKNHADLIRLATKRGLMSK